MEYQVVDWASAYHEDAFAIGGKTTACSQVTGTTCNSETAAVIMLYGGTDAKSSSEPLYMNVLTEVTLSTQDTVTVIGVLAIRALNSPSTMANAIGVFETEIDPVTSKASLIFFKSRQENDTVLEVFAPQDHSNF